MSVWRPHTHAQDGNQEARAVGRMPLGWAAEVSASTACAGILQRRSDEPGGIAWNELSDPTRFIPGFQGFTGMTRSDHAGSAGQEATQSGLMPKTRNTEE